MFVYVNLYTHNTGNIHEKGQNTIYNFTIMWFFLLFNCDFYHKNAFQITTILF